MKQVRPVRVAGLATFVPPKVLTNADLERMVETSNEWILQRTGIRERHIVEPGVATSDLSAVAARSAMEQAGVAPTDIGFIVVGTTTPDTIFPSTACVLQTKIGAVNAWGFDLGAACSGFTYSMSVAYQQVATGVAEHALVVGADVMSSIIDYTDRSTCVLFGDGAGAVVVSASEAPGGALGIEMTTEPQGAYMIWLPAGGAKAPPSAGTIARGEHYVRMEGNATYRFATKTMATTAVESIRRAGLTPDDIDLFIPHQANIRIIEAVAKGLDLPMEKIFVNLDRYGNTSAASVPIALAEAVNEGRVKVGDNVTIVAFGAGFTSGAVTLKWTADPTRGIAGDAAVQPEDVHALIADLKAAL